jgi:hypothetical protein
MRRTPNLGRIDLINLIDPIGLIGAAEPASKRSVTSVYLVAVQS